MNSVHWQKKGCTLSTAKWLRVICFHLSGPVISLMGLTDVKWVRELDMFCSHGISYFKTLAMIILYKNWLRCFYRLQEWALSYATTGLSFMRVLILMCPRRVSIVPAEMRFSGGHILSFIFLSTLHPLQLVELQLCTSQDQRLHLLAKSICVAIESPVFSVHLSSPPHPNYTNESIPTLSQVPAYMNLMFWYHCSANPPVNT